MITQPSNVCSVIALTKLFELRDPRVQAVEVKGDLIIPASDRIMTRSRTKLSTLFTWPLRSQDLDQKQKLTPYQTLTNILSSPRH
jgi:hypothetical protein